jgi:hypothetical protein
MWIQVVLAAWQPISLRKEPIIHLLRICVDRRTWYSTHFPGLLKIWFAALNKKSLTIREMKMTDESGGSAV